MNGTLAIQALGRNAVLFFGLLLTAYCLLLLAGRNRWPRLAARLGMERVVGRGPLGRGTRALVGVRNGYLVAVAPSHSLGASSVDVLARFPQRSTVRGLRADLLGDPALLAAFGRRRTLPRWRRKNVLLGDGSVLLRLTYLVLPPTARRIERVVDGLTDAMSRHIRTLDRLCEGCGQVHEPDVYLADGVPGYFCEPCVAQHKQGEQEFAEQIRALAPEYGRGIGFGLAAAFAFGLTGGSLAAVGTVLIPRVAPYIAIAIFFGVGYLVAALASRGFLGASLASALAKLPVVAVGACVAYTAANAVTTMTLAPAVWNLTLLSNSSWRAATAAPRPALYLASAAAAGWIAESIVLLGSRRRRVRPTRIERVDFASQST